VPHIEALFNNDFSILRSEPVSDGQGGWSEVYIALDSVRGRMRPASGSEREVAAQMQRAITHVLYVLAGADMFRGDYVVGGGVTALVQGVREPSQAGQHLEVDCLELQKVPGSEAGS
jgi:head-tail adaptor